MTLKKLCSEVRNLISPNYFAYGFLIVWKNARSWNWYHIIGDDWESIKESDERYDEGFDFLFKDKEVMQMMEEIIKADDRATIIISDELEPDTWTCKSLMEDIKSMYGKEGCSLANFYGCCCTD